MFPYSCLIGDTREIFWGVFFIRHFKNEVDFPFGHGLSYTRFRYSNLKLESEEATACDTMRLSVKVTNIGDRDGDEVVQVSTHIHVHTYMHTYILYIYIYKQCTHINTRAYTYTYTHTYIYLVVVCLTSLSSLSLLCTLGSRRAWFLCIACSSRQQNSRFRNGIWIGLFAHAWCNGTDYQHTPCWFWTCSYPIGRKCLGSFECKSRRESCGVRQRRHLRGKGNIDIVLMYEWWSSVCKKQYYLVVHSF